MRIATVLPALILQAAHARVAKQYTR
jgi:hypothetical protein